MKHSVLHKRRMRKVKKSFDIPDEDDVFVIADTALKSYTEGFAVCTSGIYYIGNNCKEKGKLTWKELIDSLIDAGLDGIEGQYTYDKTSYAGTPTKEEIYQEISQRYRGRIPPVKFD